MVWWAQVCDNFFIYVYAHILKLGQSLQLLRIYSKLLFNIFFCLNVTITVTGCYQVNDKIIFH